MFSFVFEDFERFWKKCGLKVHFQYKNLLLRQGEYFYFLHISSSEAIGEYVSTITTLLTRQYVLYTPVLSYMRTIAICIGVG